MNKLFLLAAVSALMVNGAYPQNRGTDSARQLKIGEVAQLGDSLTMKVTKGTKSVFKDVKVKGELVVVVFELDAGKKGATLSYQLSADPKLSEVHLAVGAERTAPRAVMEDFPSWGNDNDKDVEVLNSADKAAGVTLTFERKGSVSLLFDVPPEQAKTSQKFSIVFRTIKPKSEQYSFVVNL